jgi:uncharacterized protein
VTKLLLNWAIASLLAVTTALTSVAGFAQNFVTIGTGGITGVYYPGGGAICRFVNQARKEHGLRCTVEATGGSVFNVNAIATGDLDIGFTQADVQYFAVNGLDRFKESGKVASLRALFSLHAEAFTVVARRDANIKDWGDVRGKRVNIGEAGSGMYTITNELLRDAGIAHSDLKLATELKQLEMAGALCDNKIDVFTYMVGHPNASIKEASTSCSSVIVPLSDALIDKVLKRSPYYSPITIPGKMYAGTDNPVKTIGVRATIVTSTKLPDKAAYAIVKAVFDNLDEFKKLHPAFESLEAKDMVTGNTAPFHPGALTYFREKGLIK